MAGVLKSGSGPSSCPYSLECVEGRFCELRLETVRKGVRVTLRACVWPVYRGQNAPNRPVWVPCGPAFRVPPGLFGQFLLGILRSSRQCADGGTMHPVERLTRH
jgi:hypothetical protein